MAVYLLDTNVIIDVLNNKKHRGAFLLELTEGGHILACCPINVAEIHPGMKPKEERRTTALLASLLFFPITFPIAELAGQLKQIHSRKGRTLSIPDTIIVAVAIYNHLTLLTDNTKDFPMRELNIHPLPQLRTGMV
jgi:predicted nucleic acid-binding protein